MLTFEIPAVKRRNGVEVNWSRYRDTGVTDPALLFIPTQPTLKPCVCNELMNLFCSSKPHIFIQYFQQILNLILKLNQKHNVISNNLLINNVYVEPVTFTKNI